MNSIERLEHDVPTPEIHPSFTPVEVSPDEVQFRVGPWSGPVYTIADDDGDGEVRRLVRSLDGTTPVREIVADFEGETRQQVVSILSALAEKGVLAPGEQTTDGERRDDAARYGTVRASLSEDDFAAARRKDVAVVGGGTAADLVAENLAGMDIDPATVAPDERGVLSEVVESADLLVCALDRPRPGLLADLNRRANDAGTRWLVGQIHGLDGLVGPTVVPGETACYECFRERMLANVEFRTDAYGEEYAGNATAMGIPALAQIVAGYLTLDAFHLLVGNAGFTAGSVLHFDFFDFGVESNEVLKRPRCAVCGRDRDAPQRFVTVEQLVADREADADR
ncbi:TOMM precursor leader peptide-binding protein [Halorussus pelagicus]|uniref:TOMM precursor leader peptide-binding protein n=1 Tax=Halorussus pelagicus TaxID=2505977 RepID=UPI000FFBF874|nr:TOMM precursor leader peptide-binding protein [Halorussus pelagicus]